MNLEGIVEEGYPIDNSHRACGVQMSSPFWAEVAFAPAGVGAVLSASFQKTLHNHNPMFQFPQVIIVLISKAPYPLASARPSRSKLLLYSLGLLENS